MLTLDPLPRDHDPAPCADRLDLVDAVYERPGSPAAREMEQLCRRCPVASACLDHAMRNREHGMWGGVTPRQRTDRGAPGSESKVSRDSAKVGGGDQ